MEHFDQFDLSFEQVFLGFLSLAGRLLEVRRAESFESMIWAFSAQIQISRLSKYRQNLGHRDEGNELVDPSVPGPPAATASRRKRTRAKTKA